jgi:hypothetical protein
MNNTERVHLLFRGGAEVTKALRFGALVCELGAAAIAVVVILVKPKDPSAWLPLCILGITFVGTALRSYSSVAKGFSQRCRRISLRAFCKQEDLDHRLAAMMEDDSPLGVDLLARRLPAQNLNEYYEPTMPPGGLRYAELYAHSAFYTWRQLRIQSWVTFIVPSIVIALCTVMVYRLAAQPGLPVDRHAVLEAVCTVVLLVIGAKGLEAWWETYTSYRDIRPIETALLLIPQGDELLETIDAYDIERAAGAQPWTLIYRIRRDRLAALWHQRRKAFERALQEGKNVGPVTSN